MTGILTYPGSEKRDWTPIVGLTVNPDQPLTYREMSKSGSDIILDFLWDAVTIELVLDLMFAFLDVLISS